MKELQSLKEVVNKLKSGCQECRGARGSGVFGHQQADQIPIQGDAGEKVTGQEVQGGSSQEERGDGMVPGATVDAARPGSIFGKPAPSQNMQEMQVRGKVNTYRKRYKTEPGINHLPYKYTWLSSNLSFIHLDLKLFWYSSIQCAFSATSVEHRGVYNM